MKDSRRAFRGSRALILAAVAGAGLAGLRALSGSEAGRSFLLREEIVLRNFPAGSKSARVWLPVATSDEFQTVELARVASPVPARRTTDPEYGNGALYVEIPDPSRGDVRFALDFRASRREYSTDPGSPASASVATPRDLGRYLKADRLVPIDGKFRRMSDEITAGKTLPVEKARAIYDYVFRTMKYDKSGEGWGRGDSLWACDSKRGNCTDFHSLFISLMRAQGIPARFEIGFPLSGSPEGEIAGYHCWAEFYVEGKGWIPVDISEAWKAPAKRDYFFGNLDANRIRFSTGRDLTLEPKPDGPPLNYFVYPYVEVDGKPFEGSMERKIRYSQPSPASTK